MSSAHTGPDRNRLAGAAHLVGRAAMILILAVCPIWGQASRTDRGQVDTTGEKVLSAEAQSFDGRIIDSIVIENRNVFNTTRSPYNNILFRTANHIHRVTRKHVIAREFLFKVGQPFSAQLAEETARNLRTRYWLYDAWIVPDTLPNGHLILTVNTIDEWSLRAWISITRAANLTDYQFSVEETNFLGNNQYLSLYYFVPATEANYVQLDFRDQRFLGKPYLVDLLYSGNPTEKIHRISFARPYYNLLQRSTFEIDVGNQSGRRDTYNNTVRTSQSQRRGDQDRVYFENRWGSYDRKIGASLEYDYRFERTADRLVLDSTYPVTFPSDSLYHQVTADVYYAYINYIKTRRINGFTYVEDIQTGYRLDLSFGRAFSAYSRGKLLDVAEATLTFGYRYASHLFLLTYDREFWYKDNTTLRRTTNLTGIYYNNGLSFVTLAVRGMYLSDRRPYASQDIRLDGATGLRGYDRYFRTGDRAMLFNIEGRFYPGLSLLDVLFGGVVFSDFGQVWKPLATMPGDRFHWNVGAGLRISLEKITKNELIRIDVAYTESHKWQSAFGTSQYF